MRPYIAEMIGTFFLVLAGSGAAQMAANETHSINLLAGAIAVGCVLFIFITLFGSISGAHFNPAVSLAFRIIGVIDTKVMFIFIVSQIIGGILATWAVHLMFGLPIFQIADPAPFTIGLGASELLMTSGLIFVIFFGIYQNSAQIPALVASFVAAGYFMSSSSVVANPAVTVARFLTDVPTTIGMPKALIFILIQFASAPLVMWFFKGKISVN